MRGVLLALGMSACVILKSTPADEAREVAREYCRCVAPTDDRCVDEIVAVVGASVDSACSDCVFEHERTCASMELVCTPLCTRGIQ